MGSAAAASFGRPACAPNRRGTVGSYSKQGTAYVFVRPGTTWSNPTQNETSKLTAADGSASDMFGWSISLSPAQSGPGLIAVGAPDASSNSGAAYVYSYCDGCVLFNPFTVSSLAITTGGRAGFTLKGSFTLGSGSSGIDPTSSGVTLVIDSKTFTIANSLFGVNRKANWTYSGTGSDGITWNAQIAGGPSSYSFQFKASGATTDLTGTANPMSVTLIIGNDRGTTSVTARIH